MWQHCTKKSEWSTNPLAYLEESKKASGNQMNQSKVQSLFLTLETAVEKTQSHHHIFLVDVVEL